MLAEPNSSSTPLYPCGLCSNEVEDSHKATQCDDCNTWYHNECMGISDSFYIRLMNRPNSSWICCTCGLPNFATSLYGEFSVTVSNRFDCLDPSSGLTLDVSDIPDPKDFVPKHISSPKPRNNSGRNKMRKIKAVLINCNGLKSEKSRTDFQAAIKQHNPDVIFGCESKLNSDIPTYSVFPDNYEVLRKDCNSYGGGVFLAIRSDMVVLDRPEFDSNSEIIWTTVAFAGFFLLCNFIGGPPKPILGPPKG